MQILLIVQVHFHLLLLYFWFRLDFSAGSYFRFSIWCHCFYEANDLRCVNGQWLKGQQ